MITYRESVTCPGIHQVFRDDVLVGQFSSLEEVLAVWPEAVPENWEALADRVLNKIRFNRQTSFTTQW
jgi:hypothetical protein